MKRPAALLMSLLCSFGPAPSAVATDHDFRRGWPPRRPAPVPEVYCPALADPVGCLLEKQAPADSVVPAGWQAGVENDIRRAEYELSWQRSPAPGIPDAYQAPNRAHGFRTRFTEGGASLAPRDDEEAAEAAEWTWGLRLARFGAAGNTVPVVPAAPSVRANRAEYDHGVLTEWFVNDERGLEQGFTIHRPVAAPAASPAAELHVDLAISGDLLAYPAEDRQSIEFRDGHGARVIRYGELFSHDASGRSLPSRMEALAPVDGIPARVRIVVGAAGAVYPITIDQLATSPAWTAESDQAYAAFGNSVASAGDVNGDGYSDVIVGAYQFDNGQTEEGRASLYLGSGSGLATTPAWTAEGDQADASFGHSVASAGDVNGDGYSDVIVGARWFDNGQVSEGKAFLYMGSASGLAATPAWTAEGDEVGAVFGYSVASAGDVNGDGYSDIIVGAYAFTNGQTYEGRAFLYLGSATGLAATPAWTAESDQAYAWFGISVASAGDVNGDGYSDVVVGAYGFTNGQSGEGRAFLYLGSASGLATTPAWTAESDQGSAVFGASVASAGDVNGDGYSDVIVGAPDFDNAEPDGGRAFLYMGSASGLAATPAWTAEGDQASAYFGISVASAGDVNGDGYSDVVVGAPLSGDFQQPYEGRAFLYLGSPSGLAATPAWTAESDQAYANLGGSVASAGDVNGDGYSDIIVGAIDFDNVQTDEGRAFLYLGSASGLASTPAWTAEGDQDYASFGVSVASAGDVNGDGYSDVIVGAQYFDTVEADEGRAFLYLGSASGLATTPAWTAEGDQASAYFGASVASAGDVNGDGYSDVIVGAIYFSNVQAGEGRAFLYLGSGSGLAATPAWTAESDQAGALFGWSVASAGDVNGDGFSDVIVGARIFDNGEINEGRAFLYHGSGSGLAATPAWTAESGQAEAQFGWSVAGAGDVNGDGFSDVIVGALLFDNGQSSEGRTFLYLGSGSGLAGIAAWTAESDQFQAYFGWSVASAGDVNGDGYSDVIVGAPYFKFNNGTSIEGRAFLYLGSASGLAATPVWTAKGDQAYAFFGISVASAGDVNGDGYSDVIVGAYGFTNDQASEGRALLHFGSASGLAATAAWAAESDQAEASFGESVASAGDVNGDGYSDVIVGAQYFDNVETDEGRAFLYAGNEGFGVPLLPRQFQIDGSTPIAPLCRTNSDSFQAAARGKSPFGRGDLALQWEVKALSVLLDGTATNTTAWSDSGVTGTPLAGSTVFPSNDPYHWRARLRYHPTTIPFQPASRWLSIQPGGWQQTHLRSLAAVPPDESSEPATQQFILTKNGVNIDYVYGPACTATTHPIYWGSSATALTGLNWASRDCAEDASGAGTFAPGTPAAGSFFYFVIVGRNADGEGSYGTNFFGPRPDAGGAVECAPYVASGACSD